MPYTPADSASVKLSEIFTITGKDEKGKTITKEYIVNLKGYYNIPDLKVGDYITGYTLRDTTNSEVAEEITNLNTEINSLSGYETTQTLSQESNVQWRVLEVDNTTGQPTKLISADVVGNLGLRGAMGYNNAVYLLNKACETLYSGEQGTARSITIEDLEEHYSATGKQVKADYKSVETKFGDKKRYTGMYSYYPQIAKEEKEIGIDSEIYTAEDGNTYNTLNNSGIEGSDKGTVPYEGTESKGSAYDQASSNGITVAQTYYSLNAASSLNECYENEVYYILFHAVRGYYWMASRCVNANSSLNYCNFNVRCAHSSYVGGGILFYSYNDPDSNGNALRPIINLTSNIQAEYVGASSSTGYNTWNIQ